jgi:hypothetical protein
MTSVLVSTVKDEYMYSQCARSSRVHEGQAMVVIVIILT